MVEISYKKHIRVNEEKELVVCYNLISEDNQYHVQCYIENAVDGKSTTFSEVKNFTKDKETGIRFVEVIANAEVLPVHLEDIWEDYFAF